MKYKVALVGAGRIGQIHARNAEQHPKLELTALVEPNDAAARCFVEELGQGVSVVSLEEVLANREIAGVIVASSTDTHLEISQRAVQAGKAIFCEKPIDLDVERVRRAADVLADAPFLVGFNRRFDPNFQVLKQQLEEGDVGQIESLQIISHDPAPPSLDYIAVSGGLFKDMAIHDFDMARWLLGEEIVEVWAMGSCLAFPAIGKAGDIDTARAVLRTASGKLCVISNTRNAPYGYDQRIEAYCSGGMLRASNMLAHTVEVSFGEGARSSPLQNFFLFRYAEAYRREMDHFAEILGGARPRVSYADGLAALELAQRATDQVHHARKNESSLQ